MPKDLLIIYEPALFLGVVVLWAGWEWWSVRKAGSKPADPPKGERKD